jgi:archaeal type IV pilus assembly protein PilA
LNLPINITTYKKVKEKMNTYLRKIKKNSKALSPVVASIILIAVTVAVSVVVAAWMGGMTIGLMETAEQATITNLDFATTSGSIVATVQNTGNAPVTITATYINDQAVTLASPVEIVKGDSVVITIAIPSAQAWAIGDDVTVKLSTEEGNNLVYTGPSPIAVT